MNDEKSIEPNRLNKIMYQKQGNIKNNNLIPILLKSIKHRAEREGLGEHLRNNQVCPLIWDYLPYASEI